MAKRKTIRVSAEAHKLLMDRLVQHGDTIPIVLDRILAEWQNKGSRDKGAKNENP